MEITTHKGFKFLILDRKDTRENVGIPPHDRMPNGLYAMQHQFKVDYILFVYDTNVRDPLKEFWRAWSPRNGFFTFGDPEIVHEKQLDGIFDRVILAGKLREKK
jgi:hypothetical protein